MEWMKPFQKTFDQNFFKNFHHLFENSNQQNHDIKVNIYEGNNELLCVVFLPGIKNVETITLKVQGNTVDVSGYFQVEFEHFQLTQKEVDSGNFKRIIQLPYAIREDKVNAQYKHGLLIVHLHRLMNVKQSDYRIPIKGEEE